MSSVSSRGARAPVRFYQFLGAHSLLIGLFPFFIPVYLWNSGASLAQLSLYIALTGVAFCLSLRCWEWLSIRLARAHLMMLTYWLEVLLLSVVLAFAAEDFAHAAEPLVMLGLVTGIYNCFFWMTQRTLFLELITHKNSGRQYGNFQIFVGVFLKGGIFAGGILLEYLGFEWVFAASLLTVVLITLVLTRLSFESSANPPTQPVTLAELRNFNDRHRSKTIFVVDGLFLFLESHFWTVSLFVLSDQDFARLGIIVILLAVVFAVAFFVAKNTIDRYTGSTIYRVATVLYALSWILRAVTDNDLPLHWLFLVLLLITFFSSFFRLSFNKRFYDVALAHQPRDYLVIKSYYTQACVGLIFLVLALLANWLNNDALSLSLLYLTGALVSLAYLRYLPATDTK